jgi:5-methylcytosine-specific restriction enzyme A
LKRLAPKVGAALPPRLRPPAKRADPLYRSSAWRRLVAALIRARGRRCQACGRAGCGIYGDHVEELADGGAPLDPANVMLLCARCHTAKTAACRARRRRSPG